MVGDVVGGDVVDGDVAGGEVLGGEGSGAGVGAGVGVAAGAGAGAGAERDGADAGDAIGDFLAGVRNLLGARPDPPDGATFSTGAAISTGNGAGGGGIVPRANVVVGATEVGVDKLTLSPPSSRVIVVTTAARPRITRIATTSAGTSSRPRFAPSPVFQGRGKFACGNFSIEGDGGASSGGRGDANG